MFKKTVVIAALLCAVGYAQTIKRITFEGLSALSPSAAKEIAGIREGEPLDMDKINASLVNFYNQGYFEDVTVEEKNGTLIYRFKEKKAIAKVDVQGLGSDEEVRNMLRQAGIKKGDLYDESKVRKAQRLLNDYFQAKGNYGTVVEVDEQPVGKRAVRLTFHVNKGEKLKIKKINFIGAKALDKRTLESQLANKEESWLGFIPLLGGGEAHVDQLEYDAYRLKDTYMRHGFLDVEVSRPLMRVDYASSTAEVDYKIKEGPQYRIGKITIEPNVKGLHNRRIVSELTLKSGKIFDIERMRRDIKTIEKAVGDLGYAYAKVTPQFHKNPAQKRVDVQYRIDPGQKVKIHDVIISGNDKTKDHVIRRYVFLAPGDYFSATDMQESRGALARTGFFEKVDIVPRRVSADQIDLLVKVKEASTGTISLGGGYGSYEGLMVNASISNRNLFGSGISGNIGLQISGVSTNYNLSFVNPRVYDTPYSLGLSFYKREFDYFNFIEDTAGASVNVGRQLGRYWHVSVGAGYLDNNSRPNPDANTTDTSPFLNRAVFTDRYKKYSGFASIRFDNTDDFYMPRRGMILALNGEAASLDGDGFDPDLFRGYANFLKLSARFGVFYGLEDWIDYDLILRLKLRGTIISHDDLGKLPAAERLFMGSIGSVRGYQAYSLSPVLPNGERIGGTYRTSASFEASIPLSEAAKMRLAFFYDIGVVGSSDTPYLDQASGEIRTAAFDDVVRSSVGAMIEWNSGFGPINLIFGYALDDEPGDQTARFEFSMGSRF